jgi:flagellar motility protein MotE (MotC chaperone)
MAKKASAPPRLLPALMVTAAVLLGLKTVAFAEGAGDAAPAQKTAAPNPAATKAGATPAAEGAACAAPGFAESAGLSPSEVQVLQSLGARRELLDQRAVEMDTRQELLAAAERRVEERLTELRRLETRVQELMVSVDEEQNKRMAGLVDVYQRMRAKDAAAVFDALEEDVLVEVASRMRQANLAEVMGKMDPARARRLTILLAQHRAADPAALTRPATATPAAARAPAPANARPKAG